MRALPWIVLLPPVFLMGAVHAPVQLALTAVYTALFVAAIIRLRLDGRPLVWHPVLVLTGGFCALAILQSIPLPAEWLQRISPNTAEAVGALSEIVAETARSAPSTLSREATLTAAARWWMVTLGVWILFLGAHSGGAKGGRSQKQTMERVVLFMAGAVLLVGLVQVLSGTDRVYGLLSPGHRGARVGWGGPFINPNHASHLLLLASLLCAVIVIRRGPKESIHVLIFQAVLAVGMAANGSRGALLVFVGVMLVIGMWSVRNRSASVAFLSAWLALIVSFLAIASALITRVRPLFILGEASSQLEIAKLGMQYELLGAVGFSPWVGMGADAFSAVQVSQYPIAFQQPIHLSYFENDYAQLFLDFGVPAVLLLVAVTLLLALRTRATRTRRSPVPLAWAPILGFLLYGSISFSTPLPGLLLPFLALASTHVLRGRVASSARAPFLAVASVVAISVALMAIHPSSRSGASTTSRSSLVERIFDRPLDGRSLLGVLQADQAGALDHPTRLALAHRAATLAGNDGHLLEAIGLYFASLDEPRAAWDCFSRAVEAFPDLLMHLERWVTVAPDSETLVSVSREHPEQVSRILSTLTNARRHSQVLEIALVLPDGATSYYYRAVSSLGLGERQLADYYRQVLTTLDDDGAGSCLFRARGHAAFDDLESAMRVCDECTQVAPGAPDLLNFCLRTAMTREDLAQAHLEAIDRYLHDFLLASRGSPRWQVQYHRVQSMRQALQGNCVQAGIALERTRADENAPVGYVPPWVRNRCPDLPGANASP